MTRQRLIVLIIVAVLLIAAVSTRGFGLLGRDDGPLTLYGNVDIREVDLGFRVGGRIAQIPVEEGQRVKQGMLLAELDRASIDSAVAQSDARVAQARAELLKLQRGSRPEDVAQAQARLAAAEAAARDAQRDYERRQPLVAPGAISRDVWESTVAMRDRANAQLAEAQAALTLVRTGARREDIEAARAALQAAEAARKGVGTDLDDARLVASVDGVVVTRAREPGAIVAPGETVFTLAIDRPVRVRAYVAENQLSRIAPGMTVTITADGNPKSYSGIIGYISPRAEFTPKTVETSDLRTDLVYRLRIVVDDPDGKLRQGQPVSVAIADPAPAAKR
ncbi:MULTISPECIES: HlyD family efflux transporter periplasmic adaptor subunit [Sphingobium]|uniref:HlyD family efflux transporter periplasmic adaptor subunit n=1 Tax=Sphingobium TaxID=165695 RepID=UPI0015EB6362|nr:MULTISPECIES: HlyD family efflux transporter periplasmic adaptor subunit [Sphingobium]MCW2363583.1 HlyD family secretion protein [Sphingobium sp. B10D3B]MCW2403019.1 HlyD family secretion protein [Sphingobium sp. B10D7B]MCW2409997.1 HlyD family secretion protein [Sphingobium xanthum]